VKKTVAFREITPLFLSSNNFLFPAKQQNYLNYKQYTSTAIFTIKLMIIFMQKQGHYSSKLEKTQNAKGIRLPIITDSS
jgi:hypothetical protein